MSEKHLSSQYDAELSGISNQVMHMGGLAESQVAQAIYALTKLSAETAERVEANEVRINQLEMEIDSELSTIIARRQP
jgi:phosphate transport system protein